MFAFKFFDRIATILVLAIISNNAGFNSADRLISLTAHFISCHSRVLRYVWNKTFLYGDILPLRILNYYEIWKWNSASLYELFTMTEKYPPPPRQWVSENQDIYIAQNVKLIRTCVSYTRLVFPPFLFSKPGVFLWVTRNNIYFWHVSLQISRHWNRNWLLKCGINKLTNVQWRSNYKNFLHFI